MTPDRPPVLPADIDTDDVTEAEQAEIGRRVRAAVGTDPRERFLIGDIRILVIAYGQCSRGDYLRSPLAVLASPIQAIGRALTEADEVLPVALRLLLSATDTALREHGLDDDDVDDWLDEHTDYLTYPGHARTMARQALDIWRGTAPISLTVLINGGPAQALPELLELLAGLMWYAVTSG